MASHNVAHGDVDEGFKKEEIDKRKRERKNAYHERIAARIEVESHTPLKRRFVVVPYNFTIDITVHFNNMQVSPKITKIF